MTLSIIELGKMTGGAQLSGAMVGSFQLFLEVIRDSLIAATGGSL